MKLHWSPRSPFVRKVMICVHELGLPDQIECVRTVVSAIEPNLNLMHDNPLSKIPTLVLDDGRAIYDSSVICAYLDTLNPTATLYPQDRSAHWAALTWEALGDGILDALLIWRHELLRAPDLQSGVLLAAFDLKIATVLDQLERDTPLLETTPFCIGHIAIGCALGYLDFRFPDYDWRTGRRNLGTWQGQFEARKSAQSTFPTI